MRWLKRLNSRFDTQAKLRAAIVVLVPGLVVGLLLTRSLNATSTSANVRALGTDHGGQDEHPSGAAPPGTPHVRAPTTTCSRIWG
jgi:hypothetical protein